MAVHLVSTFTNVKFEGENSTCLLASKAEIAIESKKVCFTSFHEFQRKYFTLL